MISFHLCDYPKCGFSHSEIEAPAWILSNGQYIAGWTKAMENKKVEFRLPLFRNSACRSIIGEICYVLWRYLLCTTILCVFVWFSITLYRFCDSFSSILKLLCVCTNVFPSTFLLRFDSILVLWIPLFLIYYYLFSYIQLTYALSSTIQFNI